MNNEVAVLLRAVREAGEAIAALQATGFTVTRKANHDLLTQADLLANDMLKSQLTSAFPTDGWLSEETADNLQRLSCQRVWVVDPIDGTKEYAMHVPEFAISVALVENREPVLACVFNPMTNELYHAVKGEGAWLNGAKMMCRQRSGAALTLLASRSEYQRGEWKRFESPHEVKIIGSIAYKLALVAAGRADATFSLGPKHEWDIAAGVLLVQEAGGVVTDRQRRIIQFNQAQIKVDGVVASASAVNEALFDLIYAGEART